MHMIHMLGIVTLLYFITLALIALNRDKINTRIGNRIFVIADIIFYMFWMYGCSRGNGISLFTLVGNISPLTCVIMAMTPIFSDKIRDMAYSTIAFLNFGIFVAMYISPEHAYLFSFYEEAHPIYTAEALCHMICSLFGLYLILTRQVKVNYSSWIKSIKFIYPIIAFGILCNLLFHERLFGMDPYGNYSIYMIDIFGSFWATLIAYCVGVLLVLTLGLQVGHLIEKLVPHHAHDGQESGTADAPKGVEIAKASGDKAEDVIDDTDEKIAQSDAEM